VLGIGNEIEDQAAIQGNHKIEFSIAPRHIVFKRSGQGAMLFGRRLALLAGDPE
jgi:hypothetical protein